MALSLIREVKQRGQSEIIAMTGAWKPLRILREASHLKRHEINEHDVKDRHSWCRRHKGGFWLATSSRFFRLAGTGKPACNPHYRECIGKLFEIKLLPPA
jgi:hypothetical protein